MEGRSNSTVWISDDNDKFLNSSMWLLDENIDGPVVAFFVSLEFLIGFPVCIFIIIHTLYNAKETLRSSTTIFFFSFVLSNFLTILLYMPAVIVASAAGEWIFGSTDYIRNILCSLHGSIYLISAGLTYNILAVISVDRFLNIVMFDIHRRYMTWKVAHAIMIVIWIFNFSFFLPFVYAVPSVVRLTPAWLPNLGTCIISFSNSGWILYMLLFLLVPFFIVFISTVVTLVFTRLVFKKNLMRHTKTLNAENLQKQKDIYSERMKTLTRIFSVLLVSNFLLIAPFIGSTIAILITRVENIPSKVAVSLYVLRLLNNVSNPVIQAYFIKDLMALFKKGLASLSQMCAGNNKCCQMENHEDTDIEANNGTMKTNYALMKK